MNLKKTIKIFLHGNTPESERLYERIDKRFDELVSKTHTHMHTHAGKKDEDEHVE